MEYESLVHCESPGFAGVTYKVRRLSFARRLDLLSRLRALAPRLEFERAGKDAKGRVEAALIEGEINRAYIDWGLEGLDGLLLDGVPATPAALFERGPEGLCREIAERIRAECFLTAGQRKN
jgi:hypothetical protein